MTPTGTCRDHAPEPPGAHLRLHPDRSGGKLHTTRSWHRNGRDHLYLQPRPPAHPGHPARRADPHPGLRAHQRAAHDAHRAHGADRVHLSPDQRQCEQRRQPRRCPASYTYDGSLLTGTTWTGPVAGSVTRTYDPDFRATESVNGGNAVTLQYDPDSLLTQAGSLTLTRHAQHGLLTGTALGSVTESYTYNTFGELGTYQATYGGASLLARRTPPTPSAGSRRRSRRWGHTTTTVYGYDPAGRLTDVTTDGILTAHYDYDGNGNRLSVTRPISGTVTGTYDAQDRVTTYGAVSYTYNNNGDLLTATSGSETTTYVDVLAPHVALSGTQRSPCDRWPAPPDREEDQRRSHAGLPTQSAPPSRRTRRQRRGLSASSTARSNVPST
jgi:YD repeat-containing protein